MKSSTLKNRLAKKFTGSKSSKAYQVVKDLINATNKTYKLPYRWEEEGISKGLLIRPVYATGSGRFTSNQDHSNAIENLLTAIGVKFETGNDAPRGGQTGKFIKIISKIEY